MKKLMKKIKSNKLIPKLVAVLTICMVLLSSLSVSAFAADDEVSAANEETESITDVWTDVMNWITSSLSSVQGVFYNEGLSSFEFTAVGDPISTSSGIYYRVEGIPVLTSPVGYEGFVSVGNVTLPSIFGFDYSDGSLIGVVSYVGSGVTLAYYLPDNSLIPELSSGWYMTEGNAMINNQFLTYTFSPSASNASGLTFLGTLAVIGVAIAIAFLLLALISRFLRLRG